MNKNLHKKARKLLKENIYCIIASSSLTAEPWASPVFFNCDANFNLYWESHKSALHSKLIRKNPNVAILIFNPSIKDYKDSALYIKASACEVSKADLPYAIKVFFDGKRKRDKPRVVEDYVGNKPLRIYKAKLMEFHVLDEGKNINGYFFDNRVRVHLDGKE